MAIASRLSVVDVAASSASASRQRQAASSDVEFISISEQSLAGLPGLLGRFKDVLNAVEDFRSAYETGLKRANALPAGKTVVFTKSKRGWLIVIGDPRSASAQRGPAISDVE